MIGKGLPVNLPVKILANLPEYSGKILANLPEYSGKFF